MISSMSCRVSSTRRRFSSVEYREQIDTYTVLRPVATDTVARRIVRCRLRTVREKQRIVPVRLGITLNLWREIVLLFHPHTICPVF
jgi:hypothetical protein